MLKLQAVIEVGDQQKTLEFETDEQVVGIGRESTNEFQLPLTTVSRQHAKITMSDNQYFVEDLKSAHGTALNGGKLEPNEKKLLRSGDVLNLAKARITVTISKSVERAAGEKTEALAVRAVEDILGRLHAGEKDDEPFLRVMSGPDEGTKFFLRGSLAECVLGRSRESDLVVNDPNASRRHAMIKRDFNGVTFQDLNAKNPATINGKEVTKGTTKRLRDRDEIAIGAVKIIYIDPDAELLKSLGDIPGFEEPAEPEPPPEAEPSSDDLPPTEAISLEDGQMPGNIAGDKTVDGEPLPDAEPPAADAPAGEAKPELPAPQNDPAVTAKPRMQLKPEIIGVVVGVVILLVCVVVLLLLLWG